MRLYEDSPFPVRPHLEAAHQAQFDRFGKPGTWGSGAQRIAVVSAARQAGIDAGVLEAPEDGGAVSDFELPRVVRDIIATVAVTPRVVNEDFYKAAIGTGLSDAEYTEIIALVAFITNLDVFARGLGVPLRPLPAPEPGEPSRVRPAEAKQQEAFVPTIPNLPEGGEFARELLGKWSPFIFRCLSLVPDEYRANLELEGAQYVPVDRLMEFDLHYHEGLTRPQTEVVAGRVSALNDCFY